jgi:hypothetical protein
VGGGGSVKHYRPSVASILWRRRWLISFSFLECSLIFGLSAFPLYTRKRCPRNYECVAGSEGPREPTTSSPASR